MRRVVVTGMGAVTCLGNDVDSLWTAIKAGESGISRLDDAAFDGIQTQLAGRVSQLQTERWLSAKEAGRLDPVIQYGYIAAAQALAQAGARAGDINPERTGVYIGSGAGGIQTLEDNLRIMLEKGPRRVSPFLIPLSINNMVSGFVTMQTGFRGPSFATASACATGNNAIGEAYLSIAHGYTDAMLAGGAEASITPLYFAGFTKMNAMSRRNDAPRLASRPFDRDRDGFVMAEGAGVVFLEAREQALGRGATILGEIVGYGASSDAHHMTAPDYRGAARAMQLAIERAGLQPAAIDYINAHGTSTPVGDASEARAIATVFGTHAGGLRVSSSKSMTGHMFGAAGGVEAIITLKAMAEGIYPPTINLEHPDTGDDFDYVAQTAQSGAIEYALSNGFGFGGHNAVLAFRRAD